MADEKPFERNPGIRELARRLAAAYVSYGMGISFATTYKQLGDDVGDFWYWLAERAMEGATADIEERFKRPKPGPKLVQ